LVKRFKTKLQALQVLLLFLMNAHAHDGDCGDVGAAAVTLPLSQDQRPLRRPWQAFLGGGLVQNKKTVLLIHSHSFFQRLPTAPPPPSSSAAPGSQQSHDSALSLLLPPPLFPPPLDAAAPTASLAAALARQRHQSLVKKNKLSSIHLNGSCRARALGVHAKLRRKMSFWQ
jgi:hypothetical protein